MSNVRSKVEGHCLQVMEIVRHYANGCSYWLNPGHQSVNPSREGIPILTDWEIQKFYISPSFGFRLKFRIDQLYFSNSYTKEKIQRLSFGLDLYKLSEVPIKIW